MIERLIEVMARLRDPEHGCDWDKSQTFASIAPYTIEEAYEVADAIERGDMAALKNELGDLLLQVVFHARIAEETGAFRLADVVSSIVDKMTSRHPHIFADEGGAMHEHRWEDLKESERLAAGSKGALDGVASALPALLRAQKLQKRAARVGFDWPDSAGPREKILEELAEVEGAGPASLEEEAGDLLFSVVNFLRFHHVDTETALRRANRKFERRFAAMEDLADRSFADLTLEEQGKLWERVKDSERSV